MPSTKWEQAWIETLARMYGVNEYFVSEGFDACRAAAVSETYFVIRYLEKRDIPEIEAVTEKIKNPS